MPLLKQSQVFFSGSKTMHDLLTSSHLEVVFKVSMKMHYEGAYSLLIKRDSLCPGLPFTRVAHNGVVF